MRCVCGYYYMIDAEIENEDIVFQGELHFYNGSKEFIEVSPSQFPMSHKLYACPECGTVKIDISCIK